MVDPAVGGRSLDHRVLPTDVVGGQRHVHFGLHGPDDVQVRQRRLHHHHVRALGQVGAHFQQCFALPPPPVLLVGLAIATAGDGAIHGVAERAVQAAGVLRRVGEDGDLPVTGGVQRSADGTHLPVHHPAGGHHLGAGVGLGHGDAGVDVQRGVVVHRRPRIARRAVQHPAVTVLGVLVHAQIGHQHHPIADVLGKITEGKLHDSLRVVGLRADGILDGRDTEQDHGTNTKVGQCPHLLAEAGAGVLHHARQRGDGLGCVDALAHEQRGDEVADVQPGVGDQVAQCGRRAQPAGPRDREAHGQPR